MTNKMMIRRLKKDIDTVAELLADLSNKMRITDMGSGEKKDGSRISEQVYEDLFHFLCYLCGCEGYVSKEKADFIESVLEYSYTFRGLSLYIVEKGIYSEAYEEKIQETIKILVAMDNALNEIGGRSEDQPVFSRAYWNVMKNAGDLFLHCDGEVEEHAMIEYCAYLQRQKDFILANLETDTDIFPKKKKTELSLDLPKKKYSLGK